MYWAALGSWVKYSWAKFQIAMTYVGDILAINGAPRQPDTYLSSGISWTVAWSWLTTVATLNLSVVSTRHLHFTCAWKGGHPYYVYANPLPHQRVIYFPNPSRKYEVL